MAITVKIFVSLNISHSCSVSYQFSVIYDSVLNRHTALTNSESNNKNMLN